MNSRIKALSQFLMNGHVSIPEAMIQHYRRLDLTETEMMILIHLLVFKQKEQKTFPTIEEIQSRMSAPPGDVISCLENLMKRGMLRIEEQIDGDTGIQSEDYNLEPFFEKLVPLMMEKFDQAAEQTAAAQAGARAENIFTTFEKEFARPLTPMECETITGWLDQDKYSEALIRAALKEAVFAGKIHFRYVDRILLEWSRNRVHTPEQAKEFAKQFRGR